MTEPGRDLRPIIFDGRPTNASSIFQWQRNRLMTLG